MATAPMPTSRLLGVRPAAAPKTPFSTVRPARAVRVTASAQDNQGPKDVVLKTFGALAAVQLALLPTAGTAIANIIPNRAERAEINQKTSDLPTFGQVGDALKKNLGQNDPKDIGKAIDRNTPDLDLTKNPKDIGKDIKRGIEKNTPNLPDLSEVSGAQNLAKQPNFFKGEGEVNAANEIKNKVKDALPNLGGNPAGKAADKVKSDVGTVKNKAKNVASDLSDLPNPFKGGPGSTDPQSVAKDAKNAIKSAAPNIPNNAGQRAGDRLGDAVGSAARKAKNVASDISEVSGAQNLAKQPNFFKGEGEVNATNEIKNKVKDALPNLPNLPNLSGNPAQKAADKVQSDVGTAANKAKNVASDLSDLPNPFKGNADPQGLANDAKNAVKGLGGDVGKNIPSAGDAKRAVDKNTPSLPNLGGGLPGTGQGKGSLNIPRNS
ncbi:hypothetical protein COCOBI_10-1400 [Coccomyxa sp. Obi]|nr:hypothetical protein COCOBI_10-1400 [Coccomyxa sp. Obi]